VAVSAQAFAELTEKGRTAVYEKEYLRKDGSRFWAQVAANTISDGTGVEFILDLTERKRTEHALRQREERQAFLLNLSDQLGDMTDPAGVAQVTTAALGQHMRTNRVIYAEIDETGEQAFVSATWTDGTLPILSGLHALEEIGPGMASDWGVGRLWRLDDSEADPDEAIRSAYGALGARATIGTSLIRNGRLVAVLGVHHVEARQWTPSSVDLIREVADRTWAAIERTRAEAALRESEARFRAVAHLVPDLLWSSDPTGATIWYNDRWFEYTGRKIAEGPAYGWLEAVHPDDRDRSLARFKEAMETGHPLDQELRIQRHDDVYRWFLMRAEPIRDPFGSVAQWFGSATDVNEERVTRDELATRVASATSELHALSRQLLAVQEEERRHLARELHDEIGQALTGLLLDLQAAERGGSGHLEEARSIVRDLTDRVRQLSMDLRPAALDTLGLLPALLWYAERYQARTGIHPNLRVHGLDRRFPPMVEIAAYRVVQEALTNVARHAKVKTAAVHLFADASVLTVSIRDHGCGFDLKTTGIAGGLSGMRERVELLGGTLSIDATPQAGVVITAEIPLSNFAETASAG
jgi:PAS domain S-box-containing protein